jgi:hypothetical protein
VNNKIVEIQDTIFRQIKRLDDKDIMSTDDAKEIARANALTNASATYIKALNAQLAILNAAEKTGKTYKALKEELGLTDEKKA